MSSKFLTDRFNLTDYARLIDSLNRPFTRSFSAQAQARRRNAHHGVQPTRTLFTRSSTSHTITLVSYIYSASVKAGVTSFTSAAFRHRSDLYFPLRHVGRIFLRGFHTFQYFIADSVSRGHVWTWTRRSSPRQWRRNDRRVRTRIRRCCRHTAVVREQRCE